jgi:hypothetical protein
MLLMLPPNEFLFFLILIPLLHFIHTPQIVRETMSVLPVFLSPSLLQMSSNILLQRAFAPLILKQQGQFLQETK